MPTKKIKKAIKKILARPSRPKQPRKEWLPLYYGQEVVSTAKWAIHSRTVWMGGLSAVIGLLSWITTDGQDAIKDHPWLPSVFVMLNGFAAVVLRFLSTCPLAVTKQPSNTTYDNTVYNPNNPPELKTY